MREMENIPRDSNKKSNILVDDDEIEKNKNNIENISQNYMNQINCTNKRKSKRRK